jgi:murein DD-endopeptidase MepM/ murein hydrolase activator NlpD
VVHGYDPPPRPWLSGHRGVDLAARPGQPVYAAGAGRVGYAGRLAGRGVVTVVHGPLRTTYLPVRPSVRPGQRVAAGSRLGSVEDMRGHCGSRLCLHWGLRRGLTYLDPLSLLGLDAIRLLPVWDSPGPSGADPVAQAGPPPVSTSPAADTAPTAADARGKPVERPLPMTLASATVTAGGGAVAGALLAYGLTLAWRRTPVRRRLPPDVIDFTQERRRRRRTPA